MNGLNQLGQVFLKIVLTSMVSSWCLAMCASETGAVRNTTFIVAESFNMSKLSYNNTRERITPNIDRLAVEHSSPFDLLIK